MNAKNLNFNNIIAMYKKLEDQEKLDQMLILALDSYGCNYERDAKKYAFLEGMRLSEGVINRYHQNRYVLQLLLMYDVEPKNLITELFYNLMLKKGDYIGLESLFKEGKIPASYLENFVIRESFEGDCYRIFNLDINSYDCRKVLESFMGTKLDFHKTSVKYSAENILKYVPYMEGVHVSLAYKLYGHSELLSLARILDFFTKNENFEEFAKNRPDIAYLYKKVREKSKTSKHIPEKERMRYVNAIDKIAKGNTTDIAFLINLYDIEEFQIEGILNSWASHDQVLLFDTYFAYLRNENRDYETEGKALDEMYANKLKELASEDIKRTQE